MNIHLEFESLKNLILTGVDFANNAMVAFIIRMIRVSPSLQKLDTKVG